MVDIDVFQTVTSVSFEVEPNTEVININKITVEDGGLQSLQSVTNIGSTTTQSITANSFIKSGGNGLNVLLDNGATKATNSILGTTNLTASQTASNFTINSDTGTDAIIPLANGSLAGASSNDYTTAEKNKLAGIATGAEVNVNADWNSVSGDSQILNKPTIPSIIGLATTAYVDSNDNSKQLQLNYLDRDNVIFNSFYNRIIADGGIVENPNQLLSSLAVLRNISYVNQGYVQQLNADKFVKLGGASNQYLMADGSTTTSSGGGGATNLSYTPSPTNGIVVSDAGTDATIPLADVTNAGLISSSEKTKLAGIATGAEVNVNADWNATSGDAQILNKPTIPTAVTQTSQLTNNGADGVNPFVTALDIPTAGQASTIVREVKNMTGATLTKGTVVYISGANGNKALVSKALATNDALSSRTFGLLQSDILNNGLGFCVIIGDLSGLDTSSFTEGAQLYLSGTVAGTFTQTKILAPTHLVYVGKVTRVHPTQGQIEVGVQNGYELEEIHDVSIISEQNNDVLQYESSTSLWKNKTLDKTSVGLSNVDNTSDENKPVSTAQQTALDLKQNSLGYTPFRFINNTQSSGSALTGETQMIRITIPANSFASTDKFKFRFAISKIGTANVSNIRVKLSTSASMPSGATNLIAIFNPTNTTIYAPVERAMAIIGGNLKGFSFSTSNTTDSGSSTTASFQQVAFDVTQTQYLYIAINVNPTTDVSYLEMVELTN